MFLQGTLVMNVQVHDQSRSFCHGQASQLDMSAAVIPLVSTFDKYDASARSSFEALTQQMISNSANISLQLGIFSVLLNQTTSLSLLLNAGSKASAIDTLAITGTTNILQDSVSALAKLANPSILSSDLVTQGLVGVTL